MLDTDPKLESVRISGYPSCLARENVDDSNPLRLIECQMPGCSYAGPDFRDVLYHISIDHPKDLIQCKRCKEKTKLEGHEWCEDCVLICEAEKLTDEEVEEAKQYRGKTTMATEDEKIQAQQLEEQKEGENMAKGFGLAKEKVCVDCKKKYKPRGNRQIRCDKCGAKPTRKHKIVKKKRSEYFLSNDDLITNEKVLYETKPTIIEHSMIDGGMLRLSIIHGKVSNITVVPPKDAT